MLLREEAAKITAQHWANTVQHVIGIESKFREDGRAGTHVQPIIIDLGEDNIDLDNDQSGMDQLEDVYLPVLPSPLSVSVAFILSTRFHPQRMD